MPNSTLTILRSHLLRSLSYSCYSLQLGLNLVAALVEFEAHVFLRSLITICSTIKKYKDKHKLSLSSKL